MGGDVGDRLRRGFCPFGRAHAYVFVRFPSLFLRWLLTRVLRCSMNELRRRLESVRDRLLVWDYVSGKEIVEILKLIPPDFSSLFHDDVKCCSCGKPYTLAIQAKYSPTCSCVQYVAENFSVPPVDAPPSGLVPSGLVLCADCGWHHTPGDPCPPERHNACTDPCDNPNGPCACGAWHKDGK